MLTRPKIGGRRKLLLAGLVLVALNLRPVLASVSPVLETIRQELGLSRAATGLLNTISVLCMGVFALASTRISGRIGAERGVLWSVKHLVELLIRELRAGIVRIERVGLYGSSGQREVW